MKHRISESTGAIPTVAGAGSAGLGHLAGIVSSGTVAEFAALPRAGERCSVTSGSRTWLIETNEKLPLEDKFLVRIRQRGCLRGKVFISIPKFSKFVSKAAAGEIEGFIGEGEAK